jgi:hypothetical protein
VRNLQDNVGFFDVTNHNEIIYNGTDLVIMTMISVSKLTEIFISEDCLIKSPNLEYIPKCKISQANVDSWLILHLDNANRRNYYLKFCSPKDIIILKIYCLARVIEQPKIKGNKCRECRIRRAKVSEMADLLGMSVSAYKKALNRAKKRVMIAINAGVHVKKQCQV